ncbi:MAG: UDP-glucose 4-epimerase [Candidatus Schekmanbacteria bacterium RBG_16_38_10]|uniref:UDP-glucose 4-epimerase n=1 Tax=Candidatus Schekmanbacteria bacterium RBG_16_38_10 TaxID=1817879 RepID=A0A1F7S0V0_9BACT|nr:MAG: UDP-glucose 4-epimerase [Candidatus Schekmanbacteria bacterium RBG_16_38_10]
MLDGKTIMVSGGTGSFGNTVIKKIIETYDFKEVMIFSRDEKKQHDMRLSLNNNKLTFLIGDVRDRKRVFDAMKGVDLVFHAAALKHVPTCEFFPLEAVKTNILGTNNILDAAEYHNVEKVIVLSTDKAVYPINAMGQSKALMEKLMIAKSRTKKSRTSFCGVRYGNVMYSRGSVIPLFVEQIKSGKDLTVTYPHMTRFLLPLPEAVDLVLYVLEHGNNGDIFVKKSPASTIGDLAQACLNIFNSKNEIITIRIREGEKMHETLVTQEELVKSDDLGDCFRLNSDKTMDYDEYFIKGHCDKFPQEGYTSSNTTKLTIPDIEKLLLSLREIQKELAWKRLELV